MELSIIKTQKYRWFNRCCSEEGTLLRLYSPIPIYSYIRFHTQHVKAYVTLFLLRSRGYRSIKYSLRLNIHHF